MLAISSWNWTEIIFKVSHLIMIECKKTCKCIVNVKYYLILQRNFNCDPIFKEIAIAFGMEIWTNIIFLISVLHTYWNTNNWNFSGLNSFSYNKSRIGFKIVENSTTDLTSLRFWADLSSCSPKMHEIPRQLYLFWYITIQFISHMIV